MVKTLILAALLLCARPACGNVKDSRPWCPVCEEHINSTDDPAHQHHR